MLKNRNEDVGALRDVVRFLIPLAEESISAYPPEHYPALRKGISTSRRILRETK